MRVYNLTSQNWEFREDKKKKLLVNPLSQPAMEISCAWEPYQRFTELLSQV